MVDALDGLRQFHSNTIRIAVIEAERADAIADRNLASAMLVDSATAARAAAPANVQCSCCLKRLGEVGAYLHVWWEPIREKEFRFLCTDCGHSDEAVQGVLDWLTQIEQGLRTDESSA